MSIGSSRTEHLNFGTTGICQKYCAWFVCSLDDRPSCGCQADATDSLYRLHGRHQQSKERNDQGNPE